MIIKRQIFILFLFSNLFLLFAGEPIILEYSDSLIGEQDSIINIRKLVGNVKLRQRNVTLNCNEAIQYIGLNKYDLIGNVIIKQNTLTLKSPEITYNGNTYIAEAKNGVKITDKETKLTANYGTYNTQTLIADFAGNVLVEDDSTVIYSDYVQHNRNNRQSNAWGKVLIIGKYTKARLIGDSIVNMPLANFTEVFGNPKLLQIDTANQNERYDTLFISSIRMKAIRDPDDERYVAQGNVQVIRNNLQAKADNATYFKDRNKILLENYPVLWYDSTQLFADTIIVYFENNKLKKIEAISKAFSVSMNDITNANRKDQMSGKFIEILFENDTLRKINSIGEARSLYFINTDGQPDGLISVGADKITIEINENKAENIIMFNNIPGEYLPEPLVTNKESNYYLPGFRLSTEKPQKIDYSIFEIKNRTKNKGEELK